MNQAVGNTAIVNVVVIFVIIISGLFVSSMSYSKAYKVKNVIIDAIEEHEGYDENTVAQIEATLSDMGYRINRNGVQTCSAPDVSADSIEILNSSNNYRYCVYRITEARGTYYAATAYMYFDIPLLADTLEFAVNGHTKMIFKDEAHD